MKNEEIFVGNWYVRAMEGRYGDRWDVAFPYERDEWIIAFQPEGFYGEICRPHRPVKKTWSIKNGIITIDCESSGNYERCIFREESGGAYLYYYKDFYEFTSDPDVIVKTYAHTRLKIERTGT